MESSEIERGRAVDDENARMRRIIANLTLENDAMRQLIEKTLAGAATLSRRPHRLPAVP
jgi:putative transposase